jgi:DNA-directed RNA polymerase specialized sigma subunit
MNEEDKIKAIETYITYVKESAERIANRTSIKKEAIMPYAMEGLVFAVESFDPEIDESLQDHINKWVKRYLIAYVEYNRIFNINEE